MRPYPAVMVENIGRRTVLSAAVLTGLAACAKEATSGPESMSTGAGKGSAKASTSPQSSGGETAAPESSTPQSSAGPLRKLTVVMSGDLLWHNTLWYSAADSAKRRGKSGFDFDPMFAMVKPVIEGADLAIAHSEVPFAKPGQKPAGYPSFGAPREIAEWMPTVGWDMATTASNHSLDQGFSGLVGTIDLYEKAGISVVGTYRTAEEKAKPFIIEKNGVKVSVVSGTYDLNGYIPPEGKEWCVDMWDVERMLSEAKAARQAGADIVLAHLHGGDEYATMPNADQRTRAKALAESEDVDFVFGEHVHVVQPITRIGDTWVVYGMGNMVAQHLLSVPRGYEGITTRFTFAEQEQPLPGKKGPFKVSVAEYMPTLVSSYRQDGHATLYAVNQAIKEGKYNAGRLQEALTRTRRAVLALDPPKELKEI